MKQILKTLIVEDNENDALLLVYELEQGGFFVEWERVESPEAMKKALSEKYWDIILSDYTLPRFNAMDALEILKQSNLDIPFIVVSGTIGEDTAVECLKAGAHDYFVKGRLFRLNSAIMRELEDLETRRARYKAEQDAENSYQLLQQYAMQLEQSNKELEHFATLASHDMQNPLRKIQTFSDMAQDAFRNDKFTEGYDYLNRLRRSAHTMQELINSLLSLSRVMRTGQSFKKLELSKVIHQAQEELQDYIEETGGQIEIGGTCGIIEADETQLEQVFKNLLENGLKFHKKGIPSQIRVHSGASNGYCEITVEDNGIGFNEAYKNKIFEVFQRLQGPQEFPGTGVGLFLVRKIVERHHGSIQVESKESVGSKFTVRLPISQ